MLFKFFPDIFKCVQNCWKNTLVCSIAANCVEDGDLFCRSVWKLMASGGRTNHNILSRFLSLNLTSRCSSERVRSPTFDVFNHLSLCINYAIALRYQSNIYWEQIVKPLGNMIKKMSREHCATLRWHESKSCKSFWLIKNFPALTQFGAATKFSTSEVRSIKYLNQRHIYSFYSVLESGENFKNTERNSGKVLT